VFYANLLFLAWGSHIDDASERPAYLTAAAAIGMATEEIDIFITKLDKVLLRVKEKKAKKETDEEKRVKEEKRSDEETLVNGVGHMKITPVNCDGQ